MLQAWHDPERLELLRGTPVNCLIVDWAAGQPDDLAQQTSLLPFIKAGRERGISFVGEVLGKGVEDQAIPAGLQAGLSAVRLQEPPTRAYTLPVILRSPRSKVPWNSNFPLLSITESHWPGTGMTTMHGDVAIAGPTGVPWVDSNGWFLLQAHQLGKGKTFWMEIDPPDSLPAHDSPNYCLAVADCQVYGSRWVIALDDNLKLGMMRKDSKATRLWERLVATVSFFKEHEDWGLFQPAASLAVTSDFRGEGEDFAGEVLNLLSRRHVQYKIIERSRILSSSLEGLKALAWVDTAEPDSESRAMLFAFARRGGLLVASPSWRVSEGHVVGSDFSDRYELRTVGLGRVAVAKQEWQDPYQVAGDIHLMLSRRNDLVRLYNPGTTNCYCSFDPTNLKGLVQILDYSPSGTTDFVTLWTQVRNRSARLWTLDAKQPIDLAGSSAEEAVEFNLPDFSLYLALEFQSGVLEWK